jgi:hypothetical protein
MPCRIPIWQGFFRISSLLDARGYRGESPRILPVVSTPGAGWGCGRTLLK